MSREVAVDLGNQGPSYALFLKDDIDSKFGTKEYLFQAKILMNKIIDSFDKKSKKVYLTGDEINILEDVKDRFYADRIYLAKDEKRIADESAINLAKKRRIY